MLPKKRRVTASLFKAVMEKGKGYRSADFNMRVSAAGASGEAGRFSVVVSKKISGKAVKRNFIKRRILSAGCDLFLGAGSGVAAVIFCKNDISGMPFGELKNELSLLFEKAGLH